ncbi:glycosyltransferase family protein [Hymenobacter cheonanensis]|uniref:glycosyltransferase family protein n=1 Tax=Hymenobacter sp. CA2-7 TaxID=3063993 RepID=UPI00271279AF|nr:glycosyltransferase family protein [Hymenobacter sp. CA2-7]MDO7885268.1 glycosyltransferase family protein [Hymenobacter sp. CA2-7]
MTILYGVPGEGLGHATRSKVLIAWLLAQGHDVRAVSSSRAFALLDKAFPGRVLEIKGFHLAYKQLTVSKSRTVSLTLRSAPEALQVNFRQYRQLLHGFRPEVVISDFESFSYFFAKLLRVPVISIDNMQIISRAHLDVTVPAAERENYDLARYIVRAKLPRARHYLITTFFELPLRLRYAERTTLVPSIIRPEIQAASPTTGDYVLVYQSATTQADLIDILQQLPEQEFRVYGFNKDEAHGNVLLRPFSEAGFIAELAASRAVLTNGGFSLISEAVYLHKPVCAVPIPAQFEQWLNAAEIEKRGYGRHFEAITPANVQAFLAGLPQFEAALASYRQNGNEVLFARLAEVLAELAPTGKEA